MLTTPIDTLMSAEADAVGGRRLRRPLGGADGYRHGDFGTRVGTLDVAVPTLRSG